MKAFQELQVKQEEIAKKHNLLSTQYEELEHLKVNMNDYFLAEINGDKRNQLLCN